MKNYFISSALLFSFLVAFSQNTIKLNINHKLGNNPFALNQVATNNLGHSFKLNRMQYYMSGFVITHDGGKTTTLTGVYAFVDASAPAQIDLGSYPSIANVESIKFSIGVNTPENNADPSLWPASHPLAPKSPSMHWGWASGYFFVALGGNSGASLNQQLELHALGNANYFSQTIVTTANIEGAEKIINIDADYQKALNNITISSGLVVHGSSGANVTMVNNFKNNVFTASNLSIGIDDEASDKNAFIIYPNPSESGMFTLSSSLKGESYNYQITDITGRIVDANKLSNVADSKITIQNKGIYFLTLFDGDIAISNQKLIVQ